MVSSSGSNEDDRGSKSKDALERGCLWKIEGILGTLICRLGVKVAMLVLAEMFVRRWIA